MACRHPEPACRCMLAFIIALNISDTRGLGAYDCVCDCVLLREVMCRMWGRGTLLLAFAIASNISDTRGLGGCCVCTIVCI